MAKRAKTLLCVMLCLALTPTYGWAAEIDGVQGGKPPAPSEGTESQPEGVGAGEAPESGAPAEIPEAPASPQGGVPSPAEPEAPAPDEPEPAAEPSGIALAAAKAEGIYVFANQASGKVLDVAAASKANGANVQQYADNNSPAQRFRAEAAGSGYFYLVNIASGKVLDVEAGRAEAGANVQQYERNGSLAQKWKIVDVGGGAYVVASALSSAASGLTGALVLDVADGSAANGANVQLYTYNNSPAQRFALREAARTVEDGLYEVRTLAAPDKGLDIAGASSANGANVQIYTANGSAAQRFAVAYDEASGYYTLRNVASGKLLDVTNASPDDGANVQQYAANGGAAQLWSVEAVTGGYVIRSGCSGKVLDLQWGGTENGTNVWQYAANGTPAQTWTFKQAPGRVIEDGVYTVTSALSNKLALEVASGSSADGANVRLGSDEGTLAQKFEATYDEESGYYTLRNAASAKVLDVAGAGGYDGANVQQYEANGSLAQRFAIETRSDGTFIVRAACSGLVLDVAGASATSGANVQTWTPNNTSAQAWRFREAQLLDEGLFEVKSALGTVLDAASGGETSGTNVQTYTSNGSLAQKYQVTSRGKGFYTLECAKSGLVLDVDGGVGPNVSLRTPTQSDAQLWRASIAGDGCVALINKKTGQLLDVAGASAANGANVQVHAANGSEAQKWQLVKTAPFVEGLFTVQSAIDRSYVLDVRDGSSANGALLQVYQSNGTAAQKFQVSRQADGTYRLVCLGSGKSLDVRDSQVDPSTGAGTVQQWEGDPANRAQAWRFEYAGGGYYSLFALVGGGESCLDVAGGVAANGVSVGIYGSNDTAAQKFKLVEAGAVSNDLLSITLEEMMGYQRAGNPYISDISDEELRGALDPNNSGGADFNQFADLRVYTGLEGWQLDGYLATNGEGGVLEGKGAAFVAAAKRYNLNEAYLAAHTCLESGWGFSRLAKGAYYDGEGYDYLGTDGNWYRAELPGYEPGTYYNLFGIGAYDSDPHKYGIEAAIKNGWSSIDAAVEGAAKWIASNYVYRTSGNAQPTLYAMKWDVASSNATHAYGWHQYATDVQWAKKIARLMNQCYVASGVVDPELRYVVPSYA